MLYGRTAVNHVGRRVGVTDRALHSIGLGFYRRNRFNFIRFPKRNQGCNGTLRYVTRSTNQNAPFLTNQNREKIVIYVMPLLTVADIQRDFTDLQGQQPADGSRVEVVCFKMPPRGRALRNYIIYKGITLNSSTLHIQLNLFTTEEVNNLIMLPVENTTGVLRVEDDYIYWKPYIQIPTDNPAAIQERMKAPTSPIKVTEMNPDLISAEQAARRLEFGGKRRKSRKTKRKSRRKK